MLSDEMIPLPVQYQQEKEREGEESPAPFCSDRIEGGGHTTQN